ncbi:hypothetical protein L286_23230 [Sphingobium sp. HDIP04]|nr:hypothetical protein L286_23230 [Sphingobium sp. HDIP04]
MVDEIINIVFEHASGAADHLRREEYIYEENTLTLI